MINLHLFLIYTFNQYQIKAAQIHAAIHLTAIHQKL